MDTYGLIEDSFGCPGLDLLSSPSPADDTVANIAAEVSVGLCKMMNVITTGGTRNGINRMTLEAITSDRHYERVVDHLNRVAGKTFI